MSKEKKAPLPAIEYTCGNCGNNAWKLVVAKKENKIHLLVSCLREECIEAMREQLGGSEDAHVVWEDFDITGQGYDINDEPEDKLLN